MYMKVVWRKVRIVATKFSILLQAVSSTEAHRINLRVNKRIRLSERGKSANSAE